jgi:hypothetical protein
MQLHLAFGIHGVHVSGDKQRMLRNANMRDGPAFAISFFQ